MNPKNTWIWIIVAAGLFAAIFFLKQFESKPAVGPVPVLPGFKGAAVVSVQVHPAGQSVILAERTNAAWHLSKPMSYPAQAISIESLLAALEQLMPVSQITASELRNRTNSDAEFGFEPPHVSLVIQSPDTRKQILIGNPTAPGDQVYLQVVGVGAYIVNADLLKVIPRTADDWRDTALVDLRHLAFDRIMITNAAAVIELQRDATNNSWTMRGARADGVGITNLLQKLQALRVAQFLADDPRLDLETFGLQPAELGLALGQGTNVVALLQFGKSPATNANLVYARQGVGPIVTVPKDPALPWRDVPNKFRDRRLLTLPRPIDQIEVRDGESFTLQRSPREIMLPQPRGTLAPGISRGESSNTWRAMSQDFPVDTGLVNNFLGGLAGLQIVQFNDAVTEKDLQDDGLTTPARQIILRSAVTNALGPTNLVVADLSFGATNEDTVFARRADENPVYVVKLAEFQRLPTAAWQLRARRIGNFTTNNVARLTIRQGGKVRQLVRDGTNSWALAPGSQGIINVFAVEEITYRFGELAATAWVERGDQNLARHGFTTNSLSLLFELKNGDKFSVELGGLSPSRYPYAATKLNGQTWVFEFPLGLYELVLNYLTIPPDVP